MKIGEASRRVGVPAHVLRHWHDSGVVVPDRTATGHRVYTDEHVRRFRVVQACQEVGMSLEEIRHVLHRDEAGRTEIIERRLDWIRAQRDRLAQAEAFLQHVVDCTHDMLTRCPSCARYPDTSSLSLPTTPRPDASSIARGDRGGPDPFPRSGTTLSTGG
ncbi:MerR family copper efflux transcriptional regulator [Microbacterium proteolyticum]|nr:MerR family copper efflux transcriptional regulator [Microbacterium sp. SORGH_AS_0344]MDQ1170832.1 MerR family copper efflux transcriptional regulator [Microbacterium proteolyticum]